MWEKTFNAGNSSYALLYACAASPHCKTQTSQIFAASLRNEVTPTSQSIFNVPFNYSTIYVGEALNYLRSNFVFWSWGNCSRGSHLWIDEISTQCCHRFIYSVDKNCSPTIDMYWVIYFSPKPKPSRIPTFPQFGTEGTHLGHRFCHISQKQPNCCIATLRYFPSDSKMFVVC